MQVNQLISSMRQYPQRASTTVGATASVLGVHTTKHRTGAGVKIMVWYVAADGRYLVYPRISISSGNHLASRHKGHN